MCFRVSQRSHFRPSKCRPCTVSPGAHASSPLPFPPPLQVAANVGADDYARGHSAAESENSGVITFRCDENKKKTGNPARCPAKHL